jgi:phosphoribosylformylglycinamidine cyclo-ligase
MPATSKKPLVTYADSGVNIAAGDNTVERIKRLAASTYDRRVLQGIGAFGGFFKPDLKGIKDPVLVSSTDGVGTKLKLAFMTGRHDTIGEDLVNHCVNDILVHGARPLFFLDYIATGKLEPKVVAEIVSGMSRGCRNHKMALLGGETAEMPDFYKPAEYDVAGFIVGIVEQKKIINGSTIKSGDVVLGLPSSGLHTNGYSLARKVVFDIAGLSHNDVIKELNSTIADALLRVHRSYFLSIFPLLTKFEIHGMAHITGGGISGNLVRILPKKVDARIELSSWKVPPLFNWLGEAGNLDKDDMYKAFNMGIGYIIVADEKNAAKIKKSIETVYQIGRIVKGTGKVILNK